MGKLVVSEFVTLDGVIEGPGHDEHRDGKNAWALQATTEEQQRFKVQELEGVDALLLGRVTYQIWAAFWPTAPGDDGFAAKMNGLTKYVVSKTLREASWENTVILRGTDEVAELKRKTGGEIVVFGSADLVNDLMKDRLVDELRLLVFPVVLGSGKRLFRHSTDSSYLQLVRTRAFGSGVVLLVYEPAGTIPSSGYVERFAWTEEQIRSFQAAQDADRVLASVLFTDIVDSTGRAARVGDREWRRLLDGHDRLARTEVERFRGRLVKTTGDGILATFDTPTRALQCAFGLTEAVEDLGLVIRSAVHTGEVEMREDDVGGIGVHIAARALGEAGERQVVVTRTVRDLATGTDLVFTSIGTVGLRGVPGEWELFEVSSR